MKVSDSNSIWCRLLIYWLAFWFDQHEKRSIPIRYTPFWFNISWNVCWPQFSLTYIFHHIIFILFLPDCMITVHDSSCKDQILDCNKFRLAKKPSHLALNTKDKTISPMLQVPPGKLDTYFIPFHSSNQSHPHIFRVCLLC